MSKILWELFQLILFFVIIGYLLVRLNVLQSRIESLETLALNSEVLKVSHSLTKDNIK